MEEKQPLPSIEEWKKKWDEACEEAEPKKPFSNGLTPAELERLAKLSEECGEVVHVIGKIIAHGLESSHPKYGNLTNRQLLSKEILDIFAVVNIMDAAGDMSPQARGALPDAIERKLSYMHHQDAIGIIPSGSGVDAKPEAQVGPEAQG